MSVAIKMSSQTNPYMLTQMQHLYLNNYNEKVEISTETVQDLHVDGKLSSQNKRKSNRKCMQNFEFPQ